MRFGAPALIMLTLLGVPFTPAFCQPVVPAPETTEGTMPGVIKDNDWHGPRFPDWWGAEPQLEIPVAAKDAGACATCHVDHKMDSAHAFACIKCHGGNSKSKEMETAHEGLMPDPGNLRNAAKTCGKCHPDETRRVINSPMALAPRMINHTRFAFGAQESSTPICAVTNAANLKEIPKLSRSGSLADDLLRRSCLRCHLNTKGSTRAGEQRGSGCSACHVPYSNSDDMPPKHQIVKDLGITPCLKCHNSNHVGADYVGLFEKDYDRGFLSPFVKGAQPPQLYGSEQHFLSADIHFKKGMTCLDCHILDEIHGTGATEFSAHNNVKISCEGCHVRGDHPGILKTDSGEMTLLRARRKVPVWNPQIIPHRVANHKEKLRCSACHAAWSFQDYGFHLMLEERADYWKWATTAAQNDPQIQALLKRNIGTEVELVQPPEGPTPALPESKWEAPASFDWLDGEITAGAWFRGFSQRTWSRPPLGLDSTGKVSVVRPMFQYVVSHVSGEGNLLMDRVIPTTGAGFPALLFNPYSPHSITRVGRACQDCHNCPKAVGMGEALISTEKMEVKPLWLTEKQIPGREFRWEALVDQTGNQVQYSSHPGAGPLDKQTIETLLNPSPYFKAMWHKYLSDD